VRRLRQRSIVLLLVTTFAVAITNASEPHTDISSLAWLAGAWDGIGDDGSTTGNAVSVWTSPAEDVMSWTFRWHQADKNHVHFAFSVIEASGDDILLRGIHHGRDFETFEDVNWTMRLAELHEGFARFDCVENCRAASVEFRLITEREMRESWRTTAGEAPGFVITYERTDANIGRSHP